MALLPFSQLTCPLDGQSLGLESGAWRCVQGHSFDVAKQGYINLLPVQRKRSLDPGDSKAMVASRQRFLDAGHYEPIAKVVNRFVVGSAGFRDVLTCLDTGCGEGYYLQQLIRDESESKLSLVGVDISKWAILAAAKRVKSPTWLVASNASIPVEEGCIDYLLCMFGFPVYQEFERVLVPHGKILMVEAGVDHLRELREVIYPSLKLVQITADQALEKFTLTKQEKLKYTIELSSQSAIQDLLSMTPHRFRAGREGLESLEKLEELGLTVDVVFREYSLK